MQKKPVVIVVGAGYAGVRAALDILREKKAHVIVVDKNLYHALPTQFYELATFFRPEVVGETPKETRRAFRKSHYSAAIPLENIFNSYKNCEVVQGEVRRVFPRESRLVLTDGRILHYDWLVFTIGSQTNYFTIPHLEQNSIGLKTVDDAMNVRDAIDELFYRSPKHKKITIVIGGGGFAGTEFAGEISGYVRKLAALHKHPFGNWSCVVIESGSTLLGSSSAWAQKKAHRRLIAKGVTVLTGRAIVDVWPNVLYLGEERTPVPFDLLVWTAGVKGRCTAEIIEGVEPAKRNCVPVDQYLRQVGTKNIYVGGDVAASMDAEGKSPMPMTAQKAIREGAYIARAINMQIENSKISVPPYIPKQSKYIIPIAGKYALFEAGFLRMSGVSIWILKYLVLLQYLLTVVSFRAALRILRTEAELYVKND